MFTGIVKVFFEWQPGHDSVEAFNEINTQIVLYLSIWIDSNPIVSDSSCSIH